jgi:alkylhydroperoxidase/carboxymuconolactone decarboxylase family protein YurZ
MATIEERIRRGRALRRKMFARKGGAPSEPTAIDRYAPDLRRYNEEFLFGEIWQRPGLDLRSRSLVTVAVLAVLGRATELRLHVRAALNNGLTPAEIVEALIHLGYYGGLPATNSALQVAGEVFAEEVAA